MNHASGAQSCWLAKICNLLPFFLLPPPFILCIHTISAVTGERRKRGKGDRRAIELTSVIQNCLEQTIMLELMAGSQIDVFVQVLQVQLHCLQCLADHLSAAYVS